MKQELDALIKAIVEIKPHVEALTDVQGKVESGRKELASINAQLDKLRQTVKEERNARAAEANDYKKQQDAAVVSSQNELEFVQTDVEKAKAELSLIQNDIVVWQKKFEELAAKTNKLEKSLA